MIAITPRMTSVEVPRHGCVRLTFEDGLQGDVELLSRLDGPVFERARTREGFAEVFLDAEARTIAWPGDVELDPDVLYERVRTGRWFDEAAGV